MIKNIISIKNKFFISLCLLLPIILIKIAIFYSHISGRFVYFWSDDAIYATLTKRFINGDFMHAFHPYWNPGFPLATIPFYLITGSYEHAQILVSMTSSVLLIIVMFWFFRKFSIFLGFITAFVTAFSVSLYILVINEGITEPLYILLLWLAISIGWISLIKKKYILYFLTGLVMGAAYLVRTEIVAIFLIFLAMIVIHDFFLHKTIKVKKWKKILVIEILLVIIGFMLINIPYITIQSIQLGKFTLSGKYAFFGTGPFYSIETDRYSTVAQDIWSVDFPNYNSPYYDTAKARDLFIKFLLNGTILQGGQKSFVKALSIYHSVNTPAFFVNFGLWLSCFGLIFGFILKKFRWLTIYFFVLWFGEFIWVIVFMAPHYRYLVFALPFFIYLQSLSIFVMSFYFVKFLKKFLFSSCNIIFEKLIILFIMGIVLGIFFFQNIDVKDITYIQLIKRNEDHKIIGEWLKSHNINLFGGRREGVAFYADAKLVYMPSESPQKIIKYMKAWGIEYLLVRPDEVGYDNVAPIAEKSFLNPDLKMVNQFDDGTLLWKIHLTDKEKEINQRTLLNK